MQNQSTSSHVTLELAVRNRPGVMSHVCGLFARRAYNVEGILCMPLAGGKESRIWLLVQEDDRLQQIISQVEKLEDVLQVRSHGADMRIFDQVAEFYR